MEAFSVGRLRTVVDGLLFVWTDARAVLRVGALCMMLPRCFFWADGVIENLQGSINELEGEQSEKRAKVKEFDSEIMRLG